MDNKIQVGDTVRSFDFPDSTRDVSGNNACFVQGVVEGVGRFIEWQACDMYKIRCTKKVFGGKEIEEHEEFYFAPINGTNKFVGGVTDGVVKVEL